MLSFKQILKQFLLSRIKFKKMAKKLNIIDKIGTKCAPTDLVISQGAVVDFEDLVDNTKERSVEYYTKTTKTIDEMPNVYCVNRKGNLCLNPLSVNKLAIRPVILMKDTSSLTFKINEQGLKETEIGMYPQKVADNQLKLDMKNSVSLLQSLPFYYRIGQMNGMLKHRVYFYDGKYYIKRLINSSEVGGCILSDKNFYSSQNVWFEINPVKYIYDEESNMLISKYAIATSIPFNSENKLKFTNSTMQNYLENTLLNETMQMQKILKK